MNSPLTDLLRFVPFGTIGGAIERERLLELAFGEPEGAVGAVLVIAPAGFGKTTFLAQAAEELRERGVITAWLNCTDEDRDPETFLRNLGRSLRQAGVSQIEEGMGVPELLSGLAAQPSVTVFIDEFESAEPHDADGILEALILLRPPNCRIFVAARAAPKIALGKLLSTGRVRLLAAEDLRFTSEEVTRLLGDCLSDTDTTALVQRSEGWPVMLQLARLHLASARTTALSPDDAFERKSGMFAYIAEQVLAGQERQLQEFLLEISILREVDVPAGIAVTERSDAEALLYRTLTLSPIVAVIAESPLSIRLHPLFRAFLEQERAIRGGIDVQTLHRRAALHFGTRKDLSRAVRHATNSGDAEITAHLIENAGGMLLIFDEGPARARAYLDALPPELVISRFPLYLLRIVLEAMEGTLASPIDDLERRLANFCENAPECSSQEDLARQVDLIRSTFGANESSFAPSEVPWTELSRVRRWCLENANDDARYFCMFGLSELMFMLEYGSIGAAVIRAAELHEFLDRHQVELSSFWIANHRALIALYRGDLEEAVRQAEIVLARLSSYEDTRSNNMGSLCHALTGQALYERNVLDLALDHFNSVARLSSFTPLCAQTFSACTKARCLVSLGRAAEGVTEVHTVYQLARDKGHRHLTIVAAALCAELKLQLGDETGCMELVREANLEAELENNRLWFSRPWLETEALVSLFTRLRMNRGEFEDAYLLAHGFSARAAEGGRRVMAARADLLAAQAALDQGRVKRAISSVGRAIERTAGSTAIKMFLDCSGQVRALIADLAADPDALHARWILSRLEESGKPSSGQNANRESLTPREQEVLEGLSLDHSSKVIGRRLNLSHETVRHHLKNIYSKLGVHDRRQAVIEARRRGFGI